MAEPGQPPAASGSGAAAEQQAVWVSRYLGRRYHSTPDCSRVIDPVQITLEEAEREGYRAAAAAVERNKAAPQKKGRKTAPYSQKWFNGAFFRLAGKNIFSKLLLCILGAFYGVL